MIEEIPPQLIESIDANYWSPSERATGVHALITAMRKQLEEDPKVDKRDIPSDWDFFCYAIKYVGLQAVAIGDDSLIATAVELNRWLYSSHYSNPADIYGQPDKPKELAE